MKLVPRKAINMIEKEPGIWEPDSKELFPILVIDKSRKRIK